MYKIRKNENLIELVDYSDEDGEELGVINDWNSLEDAELWLIDVLSDANTMYNALARYKEEHGLS